MFQLPTLLVFTDNSYSLESNYYYDSVYIISAFHSAFSDESSGTVAYTGFLSWTNITLTVSACVASARAVVRPIQQGDEKSRDRRPSGNVRPWWRNARIQWCGQL